MSEYEKRGLFDVKGKGRWAGVLLLPLMLGACSSAPDWATPPDWANPVEWFSDDEDEAAEPTRVTSAENAVPAEGFPNLSSVPGESPQTSSPELRDQVQEGLTADRGNAEYSDQPLTARSTLVQPAPPPSVPAPPTVTSESTASSASVPPAPQVSATASQQPSAPAQSAQQQTTVISSQGASAGALPPAFPNGAPSYAQPQYSGPTFNTPSWASGQQQYQPYAQPYAPSPYAATGQQPVAAGQLVAVIYFAHGSSNLSQHDRQVIRDVAALASQRGGRLTVVGHSSSRTQLTDALSHQQANFSVSKKRAEAVGNALQNYGVPGSMIAVQARSDNNPVFHEFMPTGEAGNRRVEIYMN